MSSNSILDTTENCRHCLMCRHLCPVGNITHNETLTPHGWGQLIAMERRGLLEWDSGTIDALYQCADCGNCESHCVTDQPLPDAIAEARTRLASAGTAPESVLAVARKLDSSSSLYNGDSVQLPTSSGEYALFAGDEADHFSPGSLEAAVKLLNGAGIEPILIGRGRNDGLIPSGLGLRPQAKKLADATVKDLSATGARHLLTLSAGSWFSFSRIYPERLETPLGNGVTVTEVLALLHEKCEAGELALKKSKLDKPFAYIDPVHSVRAENRFGTARSVIDRAFEGNRVELFWRKERSGANGHTGLQFTHPELASKLTRARLQDAKEAGAEILFCDDPGTVGHLKAEASGFGLDVRCLYQALAGQL
ncbi:MAG: (Fe-S)-binding protein [Balneolaceae bacterium]